MNESLKKEIYAYIKGFQKAKPALLFAIPMILYVFHRLFQRFVRLRRGLPMNKFIFVAVSLLFGVSLVIIIMNISDGVRLRKRLGEIAKGPEAKLLEEDFRFGTVYLNRDLIVGRKYIISKGSARLFSFDELRGVFDDIRDTYNVFTMILSGANDVVKDKGFLHDRRICSVEVHKKYLSDVGETTGYEQLAAIESEIRSKIAAFDNGGETGFP